MNAGRLLRTTRLFGPFLLFAVLSGPAEAAELKEAVEQLAAQLAKSVPEGRTLRVAVTDFPDLQGVVSDLGRYIAERLTTRLSAQTQKFRVIERRRLGQVLGELRFSMSDLVDPNKAKQLGKMLGVEAIVVGTVSDLGNVVDVDARIIEIETSNILPGMAAAISKDDTVRQMMERGREISAPPSAGVPAERTPTVSAPAKYQEFPKFRVELEGLVISQTGRVNLILKYVNKTRAPLKVALIGPPETDSGYYWNMTQTFLFDDSGNRYELCEAPGMTSQNRKVEDWLTVEAGVTTSVSLVFKSPGCHRGEEVKIGKTFSLSSGQRVQEESTVLTRTISIRNLTPQ